MMNLQALRDRLHAQTKDIEIGGETWRIGKLSAADWFGIAGASADAAKGPGAEEVDDPSRLKFFAYVLSKTLRNGSATRPFDSDEARAELPGLLSREEFLTLGEAALDFNGLGENAKKN